MNVVREITDSLASEFSESVSLAGSLTGERDTIVFHIRTLSMIEKGLESAAVRTSLHSCSIRQVLQVLIYCDWLAWTCLYNPIIMRAHTLQAK